MSLTKAATMTDFRALSLSDSTYLDRIDAALTDLVGYGVTPQKAISLIALSVNEGAVIWGTPREVPGLPNAMWWPDGLSCNNYRQLVGWESGDANRLLIPTELLNDSATMTYINSRSGLSVDGLSLAPPFYHGFDNQGLDCMELARMLEWAIDTRNTVPLRAMSLGPTQMALQFSGLYTGGANKPGYPMSWDDLFALYNAPSAGALADQIIYLDPPATGQTDYPADHPDDADLNMHWLHFQTGGSNYDPNVAGYPATYYENGTLPQTRFNGWLWRVLNRAGASHLNIYTPP